MVGKQCFKLYCTTAKAALTKVQYLLRAVLLFKEYSIHIYFGW